MKPQATYSHESVRDIIEDITQSSAMRLDPISMGKLWDLITMIFKWQMSMSDNLVGITLRHLYEIENYAINPDTHQQLQRVQTIVDNFNKVLDKKEKTALHEEILYWLKNFNVKVSLLLRMGLQNADGHFVINNLDPIADEMLRNLGENIYQVTQNGRILESRGSLSNQNELANREVPVNELQVFAHELLGQRKNENAETNGNMFRLTISDDNANRAREKKVAFDHIDVNLDEHKLQDLMSEMTLGEDAKDENTNFRDELLDMIGSEHTAN